MINKKYWIILRKRLKMCLSGISPILTTKLMYYYNFKKKLNLHHPYGINEKLQYLKLKTYYNNKKITECVDKFKVRKYLENIGLQEILPKLIGGGYETVDNIKKEWDKYPPKFVIKCNHGCGYNILVTDKKKADINKIMLQLDLWMHEDFWKIYCEPQYKNVKKCIIVEEYLADDIQTYKFYCFNGSPEVVYVSSNGENGEKDLYLDYFDLNWNWLPITLDKHKHKKKNNVKPKNFEGMLEMARKLSKDFPFVRVDLYNVDGVIYFSELTFIPTGGMMKLHPEKVISEWGNKLMLDL